MKHPLPLALSSAALLLITVTACQTSSNSGSASTTAPASLSSRTLPPDPSGWVTTSSGLRYRPITSGPATGQPPTLYDTVTVHYHGTLTDGTVFDSSVARGEPATFGVGQLIQGWTEALKLMRPGDKWELYIPSHLAYGARGAGSQIPPNSDLIFQVELLQILRH